ncbi:methyltransferase [Nostoc ellipsosporum NOK]|nr:methyltransferase [Nostoc ellipsosporum NOK]
MTFELKMPNNYFRFKQFTIHQEHCAMKVTTEACLFGAWVSDYLKTDHSPENILDIGAGTGLLSLMLAQQHPANITAVELDNGAALQCQQNFMGSPWAERMNTQQGDIRTFSFHQSFDVIVSNPPFYENDLSSPVKGRQLAHHSAELSLKELMGRVKSLLTYEGKFFILLPYKRKEDLYSLAKDNGLHICHQCIVRNSPRHSWLRFMAVLSPAVTILATEEVVSIRDEENNYTQAFTDLLRPYYLNL